MVIRPRMRRRGSSDTSPGQIQNIFSWYSELRLLAAQIDLQEHEERFSARFPPLIEFFGRLQSVERFDVLEDFRGFPSFVGLQVPDQVPFDAEVPEFGDFSFRLLHAVFAEPPQPALVGLADLFGREGF